MNHEPQNSRRQANQNFVNALDELESVLKSEQSPPDEAPLAETGQHSAHPPSSKGAADLAEEPDLSQLLDDAVQDIEQFMAADEASPTDS